MVGHPIHAMDIHAHSVPIAPAEPLSPHKRTSYDNGQLGLSLSDLAKQWTSSQQQTYATFESPAFLIHSITQAVDL